MAQATQPCSSERTAANSGETQPTAAALPAEIPPSEPERPSLGRVATSAGGIPAIVSSLRHVMGQSGVVRGTRELLLLNQKRGFDCPGCAWPDPDDKREMTEFCENGAKAVAEETTTKRTTPEFFAQHSVAELASWSDYDIGKSGRLTHPMWLRAGATHYEQLSWTDAFTLIARELNALASPNEAIFYTSGRTSNEAAFLYQLFVRMYGTNNLPDCSNMCHESSGVALKDVIGVGKGTVTLDDFNHADCIVLIGQNPGTNHPRMLTALQSAAERGTAIISINPLFEAGARAFKHPQQFWRWLGHGTPLAALHLPVRVNGDIAVLKGILKELLAAEQDAPGSVLDGKFIAGKTTGFAEFANAVERVSWDEILRESGVSREHIQVAASILQRSKATICCWAMGLTQQTHGVAAIREVVNLLLLGGHFGRKGAGACPVRGHSNVQGDRTVGIYEKPSTEFLSALAKEFNYEFPAAHGFDTVDAIHAMHERRAKVFFAMGGNFLSATPDTTYTARALRNTRLTVHVSTKLNRSHLIHGEQALILPCLGRTERDQQASGEQFVSCENSMGVVQASIGNLTPGSEEQRSEVAIVCGLAEATFAHDPTRAGKVQWAELAADYDRIRDHISRAVEGFEDYNKRVREPGGFYLPNAVRDAQQFHTSDERAHFTVNPIPKIELKPDELLLMTIRSHDQFNTTIYGLSDRYRGVSHGRRVVFMNARDIEQRGLKSSQWVDLISHHQGETRRAERFMIVAYEIPPGSAAAYFPETNVLVPARSVVLGGSNTPAYKSIVITVQPSESAAPYAS